MRRSVAGVRLGRGETPERDCAAGIWGNRGDRENRDFWENWENRVNRGFKVAEKMLHCFANV